MPDESFRDNMKEWKRRNNSRFRINFWLVGLFIFIILAIMWVS